MIFHVSSSSYKGMEIAYRIVLVMTYGIVLIMTYGIVLIMAFGIGLSSYGSFECGHTGILIFFALNI